MAAKNSPTAHRPKLDSYDDSTGPATPYHPEGDSRADLFANLEGDHLPQSGFRIRRHFDRKTVFIACAVAYALGAMSSAAVFFALR
jgi:hypothetical protein